MTIRAACHSRVHFQPARLSFRPRRSRENTRAVRPRYLILAVRLRAGSGAAWMGGQHATAVRDRLLFLPTGTNSCFLLSNLLAVGGFKNQGPHTTGGSRNVKISCCVFIALDRCAVGAFFERGLESATSALRAPGPLQM